MTINAFLIGVAKSGTTTLASLLDQHPQVSVCNPKEPQYYSYGLYGNNLSGPGDRDLMINVPQTFSQYQSLFRTRTKIHLDASTTYYPHIQAINKIKLDYENPKIIVCLRKPVDRAFSAYCHLRMHHRETINSFLDAVAIEESRVAQGYGCLWQYIRMSRYDLGMPHILKTFGKSNICFVSFKQLCSDPHEAVSNVFNFLEIDNHPIIPGNALNKSSLIRDSKITTFAKHKNPLVDTVKKLVPLSVKKRILEAHRYKLILDENSRVIISKKLESAEDYAINELGCEI
jgi:hypothetical protein